PNPPPAPAEVLSPPCGTETILLLEKEGGARSPVQQLLARLGYQVLVACDGEHALRLAAEHPGRIHLLVTDGVMPRLSGANVARGVVRSRPGIAVLYLSGYTNNPLLGQTLDQGGGGAALAKPFTLSVLARKVREVLDRLK